MPRRKETEQYADLGQKDCWHLYGLQTLAPNKFADVVSKILCGRHTLVRTRMRKQASAWDLIN